MSDKLCEIRLDHSSYISLHAQLHNQLRRLIVSERWRNGDQLPTETQLSEHLDISRTTVRIALQRIEVEGLIERTAGRGTFVVYRAQDHSASRAIGYLTCSFHNEIHTNILNSAQTELRSAGYQVIFCNSQDRDDEARILRQLLDDRVAGLMLWANAKPTAATRSILLEYARRQIPIVLLDRPVADLSADYVASDNFGGSYDLIQHLIELGHQHIVLLMPNIDDLHPVNERQRGYAAAIEDSGMYACAPWKIDPPQRHEFHETDIYQLVGPQSQLITEQVMRLMNEGPDNAWGSPCDGAAPTAIFCINDILAIIAISALQKIGFQVPEDVSVVGFDDIGMSSHIAVPLTTASQNAYELGKAASRMMIERMQCRDSAPRSHQVPTRLRIRSSSAVPLMALGQ